jgi:hypothetical protein
MTVPRLTGHRRSRAACNAGRFALDPCRSPLVVEVGAAARALPALASATPGRRAEAR